MADSTLVIARAPCEGHIGVILLALAEGLGRLRDIPKME